ncbi:MAG: hypothetical protein KAI59_02560 [Planctomycetes bacterium]|nr:hypothetical protein [Planctomycetota bacterium]
MDDKQVGHLGAELARLVEDTLDKSLPDINSALGNHHGQNMIEFIALLLWIAVKEAQTVLPEKLIQPTIDTIFTVFFLRLVENVNFLKIFNEKTWEDFIHDRFGTYYWAWDAYRTEYGMVLDDEKANEELSIFTVVHNFVAFCCPEEENMTKAEFAEYMTKHYRTGRIGSVLNHYRRFSEKAKSILS